MTTTDIRERTRAYISENFLYMREGGNALLNDEQSLLETGVVDSMGIMEVVQFIESEFGVLVEDEDISEQNLGTINGITRYVASKRVAAA
jgi:acyl carrier protein